LPPVRPPLLRRVVVGSVLLVGLLLLFVALPYAALTSLGNLGVTSSLPLQGVTAGGFVLAGLSAVRYVVKPTRAYGPVGLVQAVAGVLYLVAFAPFGSLSALIMGADVTVTYGDLLLVAILIPLLAFVAAAFTTVEDLRHPYERLRYDFPAPGAGWR
jgi:MFS family permease